jgi:hypothetical protein
VSDGTSLDVLLAQLQIRLERLESLLVTSPLLQGNAVAVAERIVSGLQTRGIATILYLPASPARPDRVVHERSSTSAEGETRGSSTSIRTFTPEQAGTPLLARTLLAAPGAVTVAAAPGILEDPVALFLAAAADGVLLVVQPRHTTRADLRRARLEIETAGGRLVGAVLHE